MNRTTRIALAAALLAILIGLLLLWRQKAEILPILGTPPAASPTPEVAAAPPSAPAAEPAPLPEPAPTETPLATESIGDALTKLFGQKAALSLLQLDDFQHRFAATTDNLSRQGATSKLWPVNPTPGRFTVIQRDGRSFISPDNELRYVPLVVMAEQVNIEHAADLLCAAAAGAAVGLRTARLSEPALPHAPDDDDRPPAGHARRVEADRSAAHRSERLRAVDAPVGAL